MPYMNLSPLICDHAENENLIKTIVKINELKQRVHVQNKSIGQVRIVYFLNYLIFSLLIFCLFF